MALALALAALGFGLGYHTGRLQEPPQPAPTLKLPDSLCAAVPGTAPGSGGGAGPGAPSTKGWVLPLPAGSYTPTSPFGWRTDPILHEWRLHTGQDLAAPTVSSRMIFSMRWVG